VDYREILFTVVRRSGSIPVPGRSSIYPYKSCGWAVAVFIRV